MKIKTKKDRRERIGLRLRKRVNGTAARPRLAVFRSVAHIYVQAIDDQAGRTVAAVSSRDPGLKSQFTAEARAGNRAGARLVGKTVAERLKQLGISQVVFDRGGFLYHGRVREVAEGAREGGLQF